MLVSSGITSSEIRLWMKKNPTEESKIISFMLHMHPYIGDISKSIIKFDKSIIIFIIENSYHYQLDSSQ